MMNFHNTISNLKKIGVSLFFVLFIANISSLADTSDAVTFAKISKDESISLAAKTLSKKLENDLVLKSVSVKFAKVETYQVSNNQIGIKGEGSCRLDGEANELPVNFDVKIDVNKRAATDVKYVFLNMEGAVDANSALTPEDIITEKLLQQVKKDHKSENIVIAIDFLENHRLENGEKIFKGAGEIRLDGLEWKKISFEVKADSEKAKASNIKYQIK